MCLPTFEKHNMNWLINSSKKISRSCFYSWIYNCLIEMYDFLLIKENLAFKKPTYQQYLVGGSVTSLYDASNAVDGLKSNLSISGGQCAFSGGSQTVTCWVNLTSILSIHYVTIYYMTNNSPWGMQLITCINYCYKMISEHQILLLTHLNVLLFFIEPLC